MKNMHSVKVDIGTFTYFKASCLLDFKNINFGIENLNIDI